MSRRSLDRYDLEFFFSFQFDWRHTSPRSLSSRRKVGSKTWLPLLSFVCYLHSTTFSNVSCSLLFTDPVVERSAADISLQPTQPPSSILMRSAMKGSRLASASSSKGPSSERKVSIQSPRSSSSPTSQSVQSTIKRGTFMVDTRKRTQSAKNYSTKYQDTKGVPSYGGYNPVLEPEKDVLVKRLMEKISSQV